MYRKELLIFGDKNIESLETVDMEALMTSLESHADWKLSDRKAIYTGDI